MLVIVNGQSTTGDDIDKEEINRQLIDIVAELRAELTKVKSQLSSRSDNEIRKLVDTVEGLRAEFRAEQSNLTDTIAELRAELTTVASRSDNEIRQEGWLPPTKRASAVKKTRMNGLSCGEESMTIYSAVLIGCQRVTDGQMDGRTDGQTDVKPIAITCFSIADARKNWSIQLRSLERSSERNNPT